MIAHYPSSARNKEKRWTFSISALLTAALLIIAIVGLTPFNGGLGVAVEQSGEGDLLRQFLFVVIALLFVPFALRNRRQIWQAAKSNYPFVLLFIWAVVSVSWSTAPEIAGRRALGLLLIGYVTCVISAQPRNLVAQSARWGAFLILVADLFGVAALPHLSIDNLGAWAGLHSHKNVAGMFASVSALLWLSHFLRRRSLSSFLISFVSVVFLVYTNSRTSTGIFSIIITSSICVYLFKSINPSYGRILALFLLCLIGILLSIVVLPGLDFYTFYEGITFTGRTEIWAFVTGQLNGRECCGVGFGSFWAVGSDSLSLRYGSSFVSMYTEGHNGYVDTYGSLGYIGLALLIWTIVRVLWRMVVVDEYRHGLGWVFIFILASNLLESTLMNSSNFMWIMFSTIVWGSFLKEQR